MKAALVDENALKLPTFLVFRNVIFTKQRVLSINEKKLLCPFYFIYFSLMKRARFPDFIWTTSLDSSYNFNRVVIHYLQIYEN